MEKHFIIAQANAEKTHSILKEREEKRNGQKAIEPLRHLRAKTKSEFYGNDSSFNKA